MLKLTCLFLQLLHDRHVDRERVLLGSHRHRGVVDGSNRLGEVRNGPGRHLPLLGNGSGELASVVLDVLEVSFNLGPQLLEVLDDRRLDGLGQRRVGVGNQPGLVPNGVKDILKGQSDHRACGGKSPPACRPRQGTGFRA